MFKINTFTFEKELTYKGDVILRYKIEYPQIVNIPSNSSLHFNEFNYKHALKLKTYAETELYQDAIKTYEFNFANGYPIMVYELVSNFTITYQKNNIISLYFDDYTFTGGAHGSTIRSSQNWNMKVDKQFLLKSLYPNDPYFILSILKDINKQIENQISNGNDIYFDDYCKLVLETFNPDHFYLIPNMNSYSLVVFFQQYDIAPYSSGIPTFTISIT